MAVFLALFSLDVFDVKRGFVQTALSLLIHNIPSLLVLLVLTLAWHKEWTGAVIFPLFGLFYLFATKGKEHWSAYILITGPLILAGLLFLLAWFKARRIEKTSQV
jgi:hypothetical protein